MSKILVTGGVRSGKSAHAERLIAACDGEITYVAAGPAYDDADWAVRIERHRAARPQDWTTLETGDLASVLADAQGPVIVDCLGTWLQRLLDEGDLWEAPMETVTEAVVRATEATVAALTATGVEVVLVTNEVGLGLVPEHRSGRVFRDLLGEVNQRIAAACDQVHLVVAGRVLTI
ncbi:bifunctional adenosylcobinamide kinase/adenosylcobinamide-phosphate guanylyltransferase [Nocardioides montaniterrae]